MHTVIAGNDRVGPRTGLADATATSVARMRWPDGLALALVILCFCAPLFVGLRAWDLDNDEAIYSYAAMRIVETGEWLTPRAIPEDGPFLEKPPLKFWMVAAPMALGLLPADELGLRVVDACLGSLAFLYVFLLGRWQSGLVGGLSAVLVLYTIDPLVFVHGLRSNNMEAALLLSYAGGVYHFARWIDMEETGAGAWHRWPAALFFTLGFLTKFVAALFLPLIFLAAILMRRGSRRAAWSTWRAWLAPAALILLLVVPWFIYQTAVTGRLVWDVMFGVHVYTRFTGALDVSHLQPWHYYATALWQHLQIAGSQWIAVAGVAALAVNAWRRDGWLARVFLVWGIVPIALISFGSSKIFHYVYPFLPPVALGAGCAASAVFKVTSDLLTLHVIPRIRRVLPAPLASERRPWPWARQVLIAVAGLAVLTGLVTAMRGGLNVEIADVRLFRNTSIPRPFLVAALLLLVAGEVRWAARATATAVVALILPLAIYPTKLERAATIDRPLHAARDCFRDVRRSGAAVGNTIYNAAASVTPHPYNYYLREFGPWLRADEPDWRELRRRLLEPGSQTPVVISYDDYMRTAAALKDAATGQGGTAPLTGFSADQGLVVLLPGPYAPCAAHAMRAGATPVGFRTYWRPS